MELSSIVHYMNESFAFKLNEHQYLIKIRTKHNDLASVKLRYTEKYILERNFPGLEFFTLEMRKVISTSLYDYYEAIISDEIMFHNNKVIMIAVRYYFILEDENHNVMYYGNYKFNKNEPKNSIEMYNLVIHQADKSYFKTPEWSKGAVIYQIFPERFSPTDCQYSEHWFDAPMGHMTRTNGSLKGIYQKIPYIKDLGVDAIYLNPIFLSNSSHRYDTVDYMKIDPKLGDDNDLKLLVDECHKNGIKVILDLVFNHSSTQFFAFQDLLKNQENSKYRDWYFVRDFPVSIDFPPKYMGFSFAPFMPKLNPDNPECREYFINVTKHYLSNFNIDGYRLDVADEVSHSFWKKFRKESKKINPDCLIMGEVWYDSTPYLRGDEFDSIMNYTIYDGIRNFLVGLLSIDQLIEVIGRERGETPLNYYHNSNVLIGSHDTDRIYSFLNHDKQKFLIAMTLLFFVPGSPLIYYGDEIMMDGSHDPDCRRGMIFDQEYNKDIKNIIKNLIKLKHLPALKIGELKIQKIGKSSLMINRYYNDEEINLIVAFDEDLSLAELKGKTNLFDNTVFEGNLTNQKILIYK